MTDRDEKILCHIGLYRLSLRPVLSVLFFPKGDPSHVLGRLIRSRRIQFQTGLPGKRHYYQLTTREAMRRFQSRQRGEPLKGQSLRTYLGILWFCCMAGKNRQLLEKAQLEELFQEGAPSGYHCLERGEPHRVYRTFVVSAKTNDANLLTRIEDCLDRARQSGELAKWLKAKRYGVAILVETEERVKAIQRALARRNLSYLAPFIVEPVPEPLTLQAWIDEHHGPR